MSALAASPLAGVRTARITRAPALASRRAASLPVPLFAPVTTISFPAWLGTVYIEEGSKRAMGYGLWASLPAEPTPPAPTTR